MTSINGQHPPRSHPSCPRLHAQWEAQSLVSGPPQQQHLTEGHSSSARTSQQRDKRNDAKSLSQLVKHTRTRTPLIVPPKCCILSLLPYAILALSLLAGSLIMNKVASRVVAPRNRNTPDHEAGPIEITIGGCIFSNEKSSDG
ncbi:hypothetical protein K456DRAFT_276950 [Colletotrichum gloeosporioides 23]|nr:hypothetical protein K456DRAFT_276950 [Colletotrichum gloeosporioides 23]